MDREAYAERRAIMEVEFDEEEEQVRRGYRRAQPQRAGGVLQASRVASEYAYKTRFGLVATAAANGDEKPARTWCAELAQRFGPDLAAAIERDIQDTIEAEGIWMRPRKGAPPPR